MPIQYLLKISALTDENTPSVIEQSWTHNHHNPLSTKMPASSNIDNSAVGIPEFPPAYYRITNFDVIAILDERTEQIPRN